MQTNRVILLFVFFLLAACSTNSTQTPIPTSATRNPELSTPASTPIPTSAYLEATPVNPLELTGTFVYSAGDGSLWRQNAATGETRALVERSTERLAQLPAFSSDARLVVYSTLEFLPEGNVRGDVRLIDANGANDHVILKGEENDVVYFYPRFVPGDRVLIVARGEHLQTVNERSDLMGLDLLNGTPYKIVENARDADISPDGAQVAFVRYDPEGSTYALWLANKDGSAPHELIAAKTFAGILYPRFSPDGQWLAFGVHGTPAKALPLIARQRNPILLTDLYDPDSCALQVLLACLITTAHAHAAPGALWRVNLRTYRFESLTGIYDDSPAPAWSRDGTQIAIHDFSGIRLIDLRQKHVYPLYLESGGSGGFDWK